MRSFEHPNLSHGWKCPVCKTNADKEVLLLGLVGTEDDGIIEAEQVHADCVIEKLLIYKDQRVIACQF